MPRQLKIMIIGAGTGGLCLAHGLKQAGIEVVVYERDRTRTGGLQGYRVGISPDGSRALARCLPPELFQTFVATCARPPRYFNMLSEHLRELLSLDITVDPDPSNREESVSRMTLRQVLLTGLEQDVHFDRTFERFEQHENGTVTAHFSDGHSDTADLLVAADGTNSRVRQQYLPHARMLSTGMVGAAGKLPLTPESRALLSDKVFEGVSMVMAPLGFSMILHVMEFGWDATGVKPGVAGSDAALLQDWPGLLFDNTRDYVMWGLSGATRNFPTDVLSLRGAELLRLVQGLTATWHPNLRQLLDLTDPSTVFALNIRTSEPTPPWPSSAVTLLGDAIHTMTPGLGVGANTALRDAALLVDVLRRVQAEELSLIPAIARYEAEMRSYAYPAVTASRARINGDDIIHRPGVGRLALGAMRTGMWVVNHLPAVKRRQAQALVQSRGHDREKGAA